jgi:hypothetical protein
MGDNSDGDDNMERKHQKQKKHKRNHSMGDNSDDNESWSVYRKRREDYYKGKEKIGHQNKLFVPL